MQKQTILCVDDEIDNIQALERIFRGKYTVLKSTSGKQALEILDQYPEPVALILTDQRMPEMTGVQFLSHTIKTHPDTIRILLTGYTDVDSIISAVNSGQIYRYLSKPWDTIDLQNTVDRAVESFLMAQELRQKNQALSEAYSELKTLDQAKNQFMILINHELKTPLTSILSFSELLKETKMDEEQELCLSRIKKSADRLKNLIEDVLLVVGAETKTLKLKVSPFESQNLSLKLLPEIQQLIAQKNLTYQETLIETKIVADQARLIQVLQRLIHNGAKFGRENSLLQFKMEPISPHRVRLMIANQGPSISPQVIDKILRPFFLDEDVMNHSVGMGLGLTVCQSLLKAHGSDLQISNLSDGVLVSFELPCL